MRSSSPASEPAPDPALSARRAAILARIETKGFVTIEALAEAFAVSMQTVRRDIIALSEAGLVERFHGGAGSRSASVPPRLPHAEKRGRDPEGKRRIAAAAAALTPPGAHVFIDVGTTAEAVAAALAAGPAVAVVTNSLHAAACFDPARHTVRVLPGRLAGPDGSLVGAETCEALGRLRLDIAFIGCSGVEPGGSVMDFDVAKIAVKRRALDVSTRRVLVAAREKFGATAREVVAELARFDDVLTDA